MGVNSLRLHLYACLIEMGIIPVISTQFEGGGVKFYPSPGQICLGMKILVKMGVNSLRLHLYACLIELGIIPVIPTQFEGGDQILSPQSNLTGHEILVKMGVNSLRLHLCMPTWLNCWEFFIALAENSSLLLLKILYWEFFTASHC